MKVWSFFLVGICLLVAAWPKNIKSQESGAFKPIVRLLVEHELPTPWNNLLRKGLEEAAGEHDLDAQIITATGPNQAEIFRQAANEADLVIVASEKLQEILRDNAANFRKKQFGVVDARIRAPNVMAINFADEQAAFLAGAACAMAAGAGKGSDDKKTIGWLSGEDIPTIRSLYNGFQAGARLVNPEIEIVQALIGSFVDRETAVKKADWLAEQGVCAAVLASGAGNEAARKELEAKGVLCLLVDANPAAGEAGIVKAADKAVRELVAASATGKFKGKEIMLYDLENGGVEIAGLAEILKKRNSPVQKDIIRRVGELKREFANGSIRIKSLKTRTLCDCLD